MNIAKWQTLSSQCSRDGGNSKTINNEKIPEANVCWLRGFSMRNIYLLHNDFLAIDNVDAWLKRVVTAALQGVNDVRSVLFVRRRIEGNDAS